MTGQKIKNNVMLSMYYSIKRVLMVGLLACPLVACQEGSKDDALQQFIDSVKARQGAPVDPVPVFQPIPHFDYPQESRRDPFAPAQTASNNGDPNSPDPTRPREVLEDYGLDALHFVGILTQDRGTWALVESPDGVVHRLQIGNYLGKDFGQIQSIQKDKLTLLESIQTDSGWQKRKTDISIVN